jgi:hypothetical protein
VSLLEHTFNMYQRVVHLAWKVLSVEHAFSRAVIKPIENDAQQLAKAPSAMPARPARRSDMTSITTTINSGVLSDDVIDPLHEQARDRILG